MGDNRDNSLDSRANGGWFVPLENFVGKGNFIFFSISGDTRFWEFWRWPANIRYSRIFTKINQRKLLLINELEKIISYKFKEKRYLIEAITHKSTGLDYNYDKLEFLGDRVLGLVIAHKLNTLIQDQNVVNTHLKFESLTIVFNIFDISV